MRSDTVMDPRLAFTTFGTSAQNVPETHQQWIRETAAGDWFVVAHLAFFFLLLACFGWATWGIWRRTTRPEPHLQLLMEMADQKDAVEVSPEASPSGAGRAEVLPWERPEDWWKKG